jgi:hypothetical protein
MCYASAKILRTNFQHLWCSFKKLCRAFDKESCGNFLCVTQAQICQNAATSANSWNSSTFGRSGWKNSKKDWDVLGFKVCKSVHHRTIQINHQPDATIFQFIILAFVYSSTCFARFPTHHQELNDCSGNLWFYLRIVVRVVLCAWSGRPAGPTTNTARLSPRHEGKTRECHCSHWAPDDGRENARNMLSCKQTPG